MFSKWLWFSTTGWSQNLKSLGPKYKKNNFELRLLIKKVVQDDVKSQIFFPPKNIHVAEGLSSDENFGWRYHRFCTCKKTFNAHKNHAIILIFLLVSLSNPVKFYFTRNVRYHPENSLWMHTPTSKSEVCHNGLMNCRQLTCKRNHPLSGLIRVF